MATEIQHHNCPLCGPQPHNVPAVNHVLHFLITIFTFGAWAFVWFFLYASRGQATCGSCGLPWKAALRQAKKEEKLEARELMRLEYNENGPEVGARVKITQGQHAGRFGTVTQNDGSIVTIADKKGKTMALPLSDFHI